MEIPIPIEQIYIDRGKVFLVFADVHEAESFAQRLSDYCNAKSEPRRVEFFDDGIYCDGKPLNVSGRNAQILRCFQYKDKVRVIDLIEKVWGNSVVSDGLVRSTISQFNKRFFSQGIEILKNGDCYNISGL